MVMQPASGRTHWTPDKVQEEVLRLGTWFHNMNLCGVQTAADHFLGDYPAIKWKRFAKAIPEDLQGKTVLDIGCNAGFYSQEMKRRGAERVLGIDDNERYLKQARFAAEVNELDIEFRLMSVYELAKLGESFDVVLYMGVLYHLRYPLLSLDLIRQTVARDLVVVQSILRGSSEVEDVEPDYPFSETRVFHRPSFPAMFFIENKYSGDQTNWWIPNRSCLEGMLHSAGFRILSNPEREVYICAIADVPQAEDQSRGLSSESRQD
jgi:tRNA (mo5U34)-methyltransferase